MGGETVGHKARGAGRAQISAAAFGHGAMRAPAAGASQQGEVKHVAEMLQFFNEVFGKYQTADQ
eukprot:3036466-Pyramimonas_sp.AAC.1